MDDRREPIQRYLNIAAGTGIDERGIPWWDDLFLQERESDLREFSPPLPHAGGG